MSSLALTSGWYYICTLYYTPDIFGSGKQQISTRELSRVSKYNLSILYILAHGLCYNKPSLH